LENETYNKQHDQQLTITLTKFNVSLD